MPATWIPNKPEVVRHMDEGHNRHQSQMKSYYLSLIKIPLSWSTFIGSLLGVKPE